MTSLLLWIFSFLILATGALVALRPRPIESAIWLILNFFLQSALYVLIGSHLVAVIQVLVYAGAIMVLFVFVILLLNLDPRELGDESAVGRSTLVLCLAVITFVLTALRLAQPELLQKLEPLPEGSTFGTIEALSSELIQKYYFAFEVAGILLLMAIVAVGLLAYRKPRAPLLKVGGTPQ